MAHDIQNSGYGTRKCGADELAHSIRDRTIPGFLASAPSTRNPFFTPKKAVVFTGFAVRADFGAFSLRGTSPARKGSPERSRAKGTARIQARDMATVSGYVRNGSPLA